MSRPTSTSKGKDGSKPKVDREPQGHGIEVSRDAVTEQRNDIREPRGLRVLTPVGVEDVSPAPAIFEAKVREAFRVGMKYGPHPSDEAIARCAAEINEAHLRPWAEPLVNWGLRQAVSIILNEAPATIERLKLRTRSATAARLAAAYQDLLEGSRAVEAAGGGIASGKIKPRLNASANAEHRDQRSVFYSVEKTISEASSRPVGIGEDSPAVKIAVSVLKALQINATQDSLSQMLKRSRDAAASKHGSKPSRS